MTNWPRYPCVYCERMMFHFGRPVYEAICWDCWYAKYGKAQAVQEWKQGRWWRRFIP